MKKSLLLAPAAIATALILGPVPSAFAGTNGAIATTDGSSAQFFHDGDYFKNCDTDADGDWVYVQYEVSGGTGKWENKKGNGNCVNHSNNFPEGTSVKYRSCQNDAFADTCSGWKYGTA